MVPGEKGKGKGKMAGKTEELREIAAPQLQKGRDVSGAADAQGETDLEADAASASAEAKDRPPTAVKSVKIHAGGAIDRIEFEYVGGVKWSLGGPGGNKGIPPLILAADEYLEEVHHEGLPQWWYVGSAIEFRTNKGRVFRHCAAWGSGEYEDMVCFRASPGKSILALRLQDGVLRGIVEGPCPVTPGTELEMFVVYWMEAGNASSSSSREVRCTKGHLMREDWARSSHICDECSRRGTMARCGGGCDYDLCEVCYRHHAEGWASAVQKRGFTNRDAALAFAAQRGAGSPAALVLGPLRVELDDHPWLDVCRDLSRASRSWFGSVRNLVRQARQQRDDVPFLDEEGRQMPSSSSSWSVPAAAAARSNEEDGFAGLVVDVRRGTRIKAWGSPDHLANCEKAAADAGEFNLGAWSRSSSSVRGWVEQVQRTGPLIWRVLSLLNWRRNLGSSAVVALCLTLRSICDGWQPVLTGAVFNLVNGDQHEVDRESHFLSFLCSWTFGCVGRLQLAKSVILGLMLAAFLQGLSRAIGNGVKKVMRDQQSSELRVKMFEHLLAQDQALYDTTRRNNLVGKAEMRAMDQVTEWIWELVADVVKMCTQLVFLFAISPVMTLAYTLLLPLLERVTRRYIEKGMRAQQRREDGLNFTMHQVVSESVAMIRTVKTFSREDRHVALVSAAACGATIGARGERFVSSKQFRTGAVSIFNDISQRAVYCFCLWCGLVWMERDFSAGDMTAYLLLIQQVGGLVQRVRSHIQDLQRRHDMLQDHFEFMDRVPHLCPGEHTGEVFGHVAFQDVHFSYPARPDTVVLRGVSFEMQQGESTALVGASGSGKSTVASLLFRHYDPETGGIFIDGVNLRDWETACLHSQMALVAQQPLLFDTSIRNNLAYGCRHPVTDEQIEEAARLANAHEFISKFPAGYDTYVGDQGAQMSGGQKQRISIARAVILRPTVLVLDEATSALDAEAEGIVQDALESVMVGRTTLVIAHRLSTIRNSNQIICMRDGAVVERGSPAELLAKKGYYWSLVRRQVCTLEDLSDFNLRLDQKPEGSETEPGSPASPKAHLKDPAGDASAAAATDSVAVTAEASEQEGLLPNSQEQGMSAEATEGAIVENAALEPEAAPDRPAVATGEANDPPAASEVVQAEVHADA